MNTLHFNTNDYVYVKLTDKGKDKYIKRFIDANMTRQDGEEVLASYTNIEGWTKFQLHQLIDFQGESIAHLFETNILIEFKD